ncbi:MAG: ATP-binding protein, partial [Bellilinea sp.]
RAINSKAMSEPIKEITPSYTGVDLEGEELVVFNDMQRFPLSALSTGAKEQVLLALRIGLANHVLGEQKMFLILDDAFQHSDWNRRERLVDEMAALGTTGWQIIYFSMDDHIKQLFEDRIKPKFKERYHSFELKS